MCEPGSADVDTTASGSRSQYPALLSQSQKGYLTAMAIITNRAIYGGILIGAGLLVCAPAGLAFADSGDASADAVGRPALDNPAPGMRMTQALGDKVYNQNTKFNTMLDNSQAGKRYHSMFGTGDYADPSQGTNGIYKGFLNTPGAGGIGPKEFYDFGRKRLGLPGEADLSGKAVEKMAGQHGTSSQSSGNYNASAMSATESGGGSGSKSAASDSGCTVSSGATYTVRCN